MEQTQKRKKVIYKACSDLMHKHATRFNKKHGNYLVRYCPKNQVVIMDTWNGAISQGHCSVSLINGPFGPEGRVDYHSHINGDEGEYCFDLEIAADVWKSLVASLD